MRILSQSEQFPLRTASLQFAPMEDNLHWAKGDHHNYLINPPAEGVSNRLKNRPGPADAFLLHTKPQLPVGEHGNPQGNPVWEFHSAHPSMESAQAAAERHNGGA